MNCKCNKCRHYRQETDYSGSCSIHNYVTFANATCNKSEQRQASEVHSSMPDFMKDFFGGINKENKNEK